MRSEIFRGMRLRFSRVVFVTFPDGSEFSVQADGDKKCAICTGIRKYNEQGAPLPLTVAQKAAGRLCGHDEPPTEEDEALWNKCVCLIREAWTK